MATVQDTGIGPHGHSNPTYRGHYRKGCRCDECLTAYREERRRWLAGRLRREPDYQNKVWQKLCQSPKGIVGLERRRKIERERIKPPVEKKKSVVEARQRAIKRRDMLAKIKLEHGCKDCGYRKHSAALDFDHVSGKKFLSVSQMGTFSLTRIMEEVDKCEVVCLNCHRIRTKQRILSGESEWASKKVAAPSKRQAGCHARRARGKAFLAELKRRAGCNECGYNANPVAMDFDHVRGRKDFSLATRIGNSIAKLTAEIAKCEVVCANCHRIRTYERHAASAGV